MDTAGGWGKPLKKAKETTTAPPKTGTANTASPQAPVQTQAPNQTQAPVQTQAQPANTGKTSIYN